MDDKGRLQAAVVEWIEQNVGPVRRITRQGRWRPAWYVEAEDDGRPLELYVRGGRGGRFPPLPPSFEAELLGVFAEAGVKVPRVYGFIDEVPAIVMEKLAGRPNIATAATDPT